MIPRIEAASDVETAFRASMRRLVGGVALLTTADGERRYGMTMTAVMSLSMKPPALVIAVNTSASIAKPLLDRGRFCVNLLGVEHNETCRAFSLLPSEDRFSVGDWKDHEGMPYLAGAQAVICCTVGPVTTFGTHALIIGAVNDVLLSHKVEPLVYLDGQFIAAALG